MNTTKKLQWLITVLLPLALLIFPNDEQFTAPLALFFCITLIGILAMLFELLEPAVVGLFFLIAYPLSNLTTINDSLATFSSAIVIQTLSCMLIIEIVSNTTLLNRLAFTLISRTGGSYAGIFIGLALIGIIFALLIPSAAVSMLVLFLGVGICKSLGIRPYSNMGAGIIFISGLSVICAQHYIYSSTGIAVPLSLLEQTFSGFTLSWVQIFIANITMLPEIFIMIFILLKLFKPEEAINSKSLFQQKLKDLGRWTIEEKKCILVLLLMFIFFVTNRWHGLNLTYGFIGACVLFYLPFVNVGKKENIEKININVILVICGCMLIGTAGTAAGITEFISTLITPLLQSGNHFIFVAATWFSGVLANIVMTPMALMTTLTIPMAQIGQSIGIDPSVIAYTLQHTSDYVIFPYESTFFLIMYGFGMMSMKQFIKGAAALTIVGGVLTIGLCSLWWTVLGLM